jgi:hypothetical protein
VRRVLGLVHWRWLGIKGTSGAILRGDKLASDSEGLQFLDAEDKCRGP